MPKFNAKQTTILLMLFLAAASIWRLGAPLVFWRLLAAIGTALILDAAAGLYYRRSLVFSESGLITGIIVAGVAAPDTALGAVAAMAAAAMLSKHLLKIGRRNIFNPAAFGLLAGVLFLGVRLSWWIDASHALTIALGSVLLATFAGRWRSVLTFLAVFSVLLSGHAWLAGKPIIPELYLFDGISTFFVFFMLTDPRTSPIKPGQMWMYALAAAVGSFLSVLFHPASIFIGGLLAANLFAAWLNWRALRPAPAVPAATPKTGTDTAAPAAPAPK